MSSTFAVKNRTKFSRFKNYSVLVIYTKLWALFGGVDSGCQVVLKTIALLGLQVRILSPPQLESWQSGNAADC